MPITLKPGTIIPKDPDADLPYDFDWSRWLGDFGATISTSTWVASPATGTTPLEVEDDSIVSGTTARVRLSGGDPGVDYTVTNHIETNEVPARKDDRSLTVRVKQR